MGAEVQTEEAKLSDAWIGEYLKGFVLLSIRRKTVYALAGSGRRLTDCSENCHTTYLFHYMR